MIGATTQAHKNCQKSEGHLSWGRQFVVSAALEEGVNLPLPPPALLHGYLHRRDACHLSAGDAELGMEFA